MEDTGYVVRDLSKIAGKGIILRKKRYEKGKLKMKLKDSKSEKLNIIVEKDDIDNLNSTQN